MRENTQFRFLGRTETFQEFLLRTLWAVGRSGQGRKMGEEVTYKQEETTLIINEHQKKITSTVQVAKKSILRRNYLVRKCLLFDYRLT